MAYSQARQEDDASDAIRRSNVGALQAKQITSGEESICVDVDVSEQFSALKCPGGRDFRAQGRVARAQKPTSISARRPSAKPAAASASVGPAFGCPE